MDVRRIRAGELEAYRAMRIRALTEAPEAYGTTLQDALLREYADWEGFVLRTATSDDFALFVLDRGDSRLAGSAAAIEATGEPEPAIVQMWLDEDLRGAGWAERLIEMAEAHLRAAGHPACRLWVAAGNERARRFYARVGYTATGALQSNGRGGTEHEMRKVFAR